MPAVFIEMATLFAISSIGPPVPAAVVLLRPTALLMVLAGMKTWTPGSSVTLMGVWPVLILMPVVYWAGGLMPGAQVVASGVPVHCASAGSDAPKDPSAEAAISQNFRSFPP